MEWMKMKKRQKKLNKDEVRVIKISKDALFEFIYESFIEEQKKLMNVNPMKVIDTFDIDWDGEQFIFCVHKSETSKGKPIQLSKDIDLKKLMNKLPDTTKSMFAGGKLYKSYTQDELIELSKEEE